MYPTNAFVLVQTDTQTDRIAGLLRTILGVVFAVDVRGPYDVLALTASDGAAQSLHEILDEIREIPGVIRALAAPLAKGPADVRSIIEVARRSQDQWEAG